MNDTIRDSMLVGAGGHFCPVARLLEHANAACTLIAAQEVEFAIECRTTARHSPFEREAPELYLLPDLKGYGWCFRKQGHMNIGFGRLDSRGLAEIRPRTLSSS